MSCTTLLLLLLRSLQKAELNQIRSRVLILGNVLGGRLRLGVISNLLIPAALRTDFWNSCTNALKPLRLQSRLNRMNKMRIGEQTFLLIPLHVLEVI